MQDNRHFDSDYTCVIFNALSPLLRKIANKRRIISKMSLQI